MYQKARILVVDDDKSIRIVFKVNLEGKGYIVHTAGTAREAIRKIGRIYFNIILIDIRLPDMEGNELLETIEEKYPRTVKLIITGFPTMKSAIEAANKGADGYMVKPVNMEELISTIEKHREKQRKTQKEDENKLHTFIDDRNRELKNQMKFYAPI